MGMCEEKKEWVGSYLYASTSILSDRDRREAGRVTTISIVNICDNYENGSVVFHNHMSFPQVFPQFCVVFLIKVLRIPGFHE